MGKWSDKILRKKESIEDIGEHAREIKYGKEIEKEVQRAADVEEIRERVKEIEGEKKREIEEIGKLAEQREIEKYGKSGPWFKRADRMERKKIPEAYEKSGPWFRRTERIKEKTDVGDSFGSWSTRIEEEEKREKEAIADIMGMRPRAYGGKYNVPTSEESKKDTEKMMKEREKKLITKPLGPRMQVNRVCPECSSSPVLTIPEKPGYLYCPACGHEFSAKQKEKGFSNIIHSDITVIFISTLAGLLVPVIFGSTFGLLGTALIGVGIIFLGLSKL